LEDDDGRRETQQETGRCWSTGPQVAGRSQRGEGGHAARPHAAAGVAVLCLDPSGRGQLLGAVRRHIRPPACCGGVCERARRFVPRSPAQARTVWQGTGRQQRAWMPRAGTESHHRSYRNAPPALDTAWPSLVLFLAQPDGYFFPHTYAHSSLYTCIFSRTHLNHFLLTCSYQLLCWNITESISFQGLLLEDCSSH
jgi:hypothetical protein